MKIAIVHEWLVNYSGSERVLEQILSVYPEADLFTIVDFLGKKERHFIKNKITKTTFIQKLPFAKKYYRYYLPIMFFAVEQFDLSEYDIVISSSHAVAKSVITGPDQLHICMCYSPPRYIWDLQYQYISEAKLKSTFKGIIIRYFLHKMRMLDLRSSFGVDHFISISKFISKRIIKTYRRSSKVIYPPVNISAFNYKDEKHNFYMTASRLVSYKKVELIVRAFNEMPEKKLVIIGDGPEYKKIKKIAFANIEVMGYQNNEVLSTYLSDSKAFIFAAEEDFGIGVLEAQASGTPVIAFAKGGVLETIMGLDSETPTGVFFNEQSVESIKNAVKEFEMNIDTIKPENCRNNALKFSTDVFLLNFRDFMNEKIEEFINQYNYNIFLPTIKIFNLGMFNM